MLKRSLCSFHGQWNQALLLLLGEYRSTPCRVTGFTPAELLLGGYIRTPFNVLKGQWITKEIEPNYTQKNWEDMSQTWWKEWRKCVILIL